MTPALSAVQTIDISRRNTGKPRILIVRTSAIGDCVQTMPLVSAIRHHWPDSHITWVVEKGAAPLIAAHSAVDRAIVLPRQFAKSPSRLLQLREHLAHNIRHCIRSAGPYQERSRRLALGSTQAYRFCSSRRARNQSVAANRVDLQPRHSPRRSLSRITPPLRHRAAICAVRPIDPRRSPICGRHDFIDLAGLRSGFATLNPGAGWDSKRWPAERYADVARHLAHLGLKSVVTWGGQLERSWAEFIVSQSPSTAILAPNTSLLELAALLEQSRLFVSSDTGPLHLAAALGTPCVALFGASSVAACGPYGKGHVSLQTFFDESANRKRAGASNWAMREISVAAVNSACERLLDDRQKSIAA